MDLYAPICRYVIAPLWAKKEGSPYLKHLRRLEKSQYWPIEKVRSNQLVKLKALLRHAWGNTGFYRERWEAAGFHPEDIKSLSDLEGLPLLTKDDIRTSRERMIAKNIPERKLVPKKTSGSTGVSLDFFVDEESLQWKRACTIRHDRWAGWDIGEKVGALWGNPEYKKSWRGYLRNVLLERRTYLDTLKMDEGQMTKFYYQIRKKSPAILFGHAHSVYLFARFLESKGIDDIRPKGIITSAMNLYDFERKEIEKVFGCKVTNRYGCEEVSLIACECEKHRGLHINMDTLIVEFIRDGKAVAAGQSGSIVVTDLTNYGMPFIRYKVGDVGIPSDRACLCGRTYPLIESLEGRSANYVMTPEGKFVSGISLTENFAMLIKGIKQLQIIQERIDYIVFRIVKDSNFNQESERRIADLVRERFGEAMKYSLEFVENIQQEGSGKYLFCISKVPNPFS